MKLFVGTKIIKACPMTRGAYNEYRGWKIPADENPDDAGYLVEYTDSDNSNMEGHKGYVTWTPEKPFEMAYREIDENSLNAIVDYRLNAAG